MVFSQPQFYKLLLETVDTFVLPLRTLDNSWHIFEISSESDLYPVTWLCEKLRPLGDNGLSRLSVVPGSFVSYFAKRNDPVFSEMEVD